MENLEDGKKGWIQGAIKKPGSFTAQAKRAGMGTGEFAKKVLAPGSKATETTKKRARLAQTLSGMHKKK